MAEVLLQTHNLTKHYRAVVALENLTLSIRQGEIVGLLGPNGSGKTTFVRLVLGFLRPTAGTASVCGFDCWKQSLEVRRRLAYLPGELRLYEHLTGRELLNFFSGLRAAVSPQVAGDPSPWSVESLAKRFALDLDRPIRTLSSGMKHKLALVSVLASRTSLLILDEPTNTLDPAMRGELFELLRALRDAGRTIVFSSHVLSEVEAVCDRVAILRSGRLAALENLADLQQCRRVRVRFAKPVMDGCPFPDNLLSREGNQGTWLVRGSLRPLLNWLAQQEVEDIHVEPVGLEMLYRQIHGAAT
jgi:ABC-2 type transport system ATP-binding protein